MRSLLVTSSLVPAQVYPRPGGGRRRARHSRRSLGRADLRPVAPPGHGRWRSRSTHMGVAQGERVAIVSHNVGAPADRLLGRERLRARRRADQLPPHRRRGRYIVEHCGRVGAAGRPRARRRARRRARASTASCSAAEPTPSCSLTAPSGAEPERWEPDEDATATINYTSRHDGPAEGRADHPSQRSGSTPPPSAGTSGSPTATCTCTRCRCSTATAGACPTRSRAWAAPRRAAQGRRRRRSSARRASTASPCCAVRRRWWR